MKSSAAPKLLLAAALALSLGLKGLWLREAPPADAELLLTRTEALLHSEGFATRRAHPRFATLVVARKAGCTMMVAEYPPNGIFREALARLAPSFGPIRYAWRGDSYERPPKLIPLPEFYVERELGRVGFMLPRHPILAIAASPVCPPVDWRPMAVLPR